MPQLVKMPDGQIVEMPDQLTPEQEAGLRSVLGASAKPKTAPAEDNSYDMSEYKDAVNSGATTWKRLKAAGRDYGRELGIDKTASGRPTISPEGLVKSLAGVGETALNVASGIAAPVAAGLAGAARAGYNMATGAGVDESMRRGAETVEKVQHGMTYEPRTAAGQVGSELVAAPFTLAAEQAGKAGAALGGMVGPKSEAAGRTIGESAVPMGAVMLGGRGLMKGAQAAAEAPKSTMAGGGAAEVEAAALRRARAQELPTPIDLTKGQAERTFEGQRFERETAKMPEGRPLRERYAEQNERILRNFDNWVEQTGTQTPSLRALGESVDKVLVEKTKAAKASIREAYDEAKKAGHMADEVPYTNLTKIISDTTPTTREKLAPILKAVEEQLAKNDPSGTGSMSINAMEDVRKLINKNIEPGTPSYVYGRDLIRAIDESTENAGGDLYRSARRMRENYAKEFENRGAVSKLLRTKPGTSDRAVALEDVFDHGVMKGSLDDVRWLRRSLQTAGDEGKQAWKNLQGQTVQHIKDTITSNVARDERGNPIVSPDKLNKLVTEMDKDGKLDFIFGKKGAEQIRTVNDIAKDVYTSPPGSVNTSNTATVLAGLLDTAISGSTGLPLPVASAVNYGVKKVKSRNLSKKVQETLGPETPRYTLDQGLTP